MDDEMVKFNTLEPARKTFFYEKPSGEIFACQEAEAGRFGKFNKYLGSSDGTTYRNYLKNSGHRIGELVAKSVAQTLLKEAFEKELEVARGNTKDIPHYENIHFDQTVNNQTRVTFIPHE